MTIDEFNKTRFGGGMWAKYKGEKYLVISVIFPEALFGLIPNEEDTPADEWMWARCENVELI